MEENKQPKLSTDKKKGNANAILKYSGLAFQFLGATLVGLWLGKYLDKKIGSTSNLFTVILPIIFMVAALISVARDLMNDNKK